MSAALILDGAVHPITGEDAFCPSCGREIHAMWADDGEAWAADWWACETFDGGCGATGAVVDTSDATRTQNGIAVPQAAA